VAAIGRLVRWHLLLPEVATRRDLGDPQTVRHVADTVGDVETLELLHALSRADAVATGPAAWSAWKERLVADLVVRVRAALVTGTVAPPPTTDVRHSPLVGGPLPAIDISPDRVVVAAADRLGLLASVAGCLTLHRLDVVSADTATVAGDSGSGAAGPIAIVACRVQPRDTVGPDRQRLTADLTRALAGDLDVDNRPGRAGPQHVAGARRRRPRGPTAPGHVGGRRRHRRHDPRAARGRRRRAALPGRARARAGRGERALGPHLHPRLGRGGRVLPRRRLDRGADRAAVERAVVAAAATTR
jgi:[protein-PII] uridylyltransferase